MTFDDKERLQSILSQQSFSVEVRDRKGKELTHDYPAKYALRLVAGGGYLGFGSTRRIRCFRPMREAIEYLEPFSMPGRACRIPRYRPPLAEKSCPNIQNISCNVRELIR
jgi:hypothetical protein